jgi:uncharacterized Fe-S cluster protein YjdI
MDEVSPRMQEDVARVYRTDRFEVTWAPGRCIHSRVCFETSPEVFDPGARPWVRVLAASAEEIEETVRLCPSGALGFRWLNDEEATTEAQR